MPGQIGPGGFSRAGWVYVWSLLSCLAATAPMGCAGDGSDPVTLSSGTFAELQARVFDARCTLGPCHSTATAAGGLVLEGAWAYEQLVGVEPMNPAAVAAGLLRVAPGEPERSFLWVKLTQPGTGQGSRMPLGAEPLPAHELEEIRAWILAGAPRDP